MSEIEDARETMRQMLATAREGYWRDVDDAIRDIRNKAHAYAHAIGEVSADAALFALGDYARERFQQPSVDVPIAADAGHGV